MPVYRKMPIAESPLAQHPLGKSDDSTAQFTSQIFIVVFGGDVQRTEGVSSPRKITTIGERFSLSLPLPTPVWIDYSAKYLSANSRGFKTSISS